MERRGDGRLLGGSPVLPSVVERPARPQLSRGAAFMSNTHPATIAESQAVMAVHLPEWVSDPTRPEAIEAHRQMAESYSRYYDRVLRLREEQAAKDRYAYSPASTSSPSRSTPGHCCSRLLAYPKKPRQACHAWLPTFEIGRHRGDEEHAVHIFAPWLERSVATTPSSSLPCSCLGLPPGKWGTNDGRCPPLSILARRARRVAGLHKVEGLLVHQPLALRE